MVRILTVEDLNNALDRVTRPSKRAMIVIRIVVVVALGLAVGFEHRRATDLKAERDAMTLKANALQAKLASKEKEIAAISEAMAVSIDARKLGRPVRLSGEMIVVFTGEVK